MRKERSHRALLGKRPLLVSESRHDFDAIYDGFEKELMPEGIIERMYVTQAACIVWDTVRLRNCRVALVNNAFRDALEEVLRQILASLHRYHCRDGLDEETVQADDEQEAPRAETDTKLSEGEAGNGAEGEDTENESNDKTEEEEDADDYNYDPEYLATGWFTLPEAKRIVSKILRQVQLDESAIEAEAIKRCIQDLEVLDKMLCTLEVRLAKTLRCIAKYRESLARQLRESANRIIEGKSLLALEDQAGKSAA